MRPRVQASSAAAVVACVVVIATVGAWALRASPRGGFDPRRVHGPAPAAATAPDSYPSGRDIRAPRALAARAADGSSLNGRRVVVAAEAGSAAGVQLATPSLPAGELEVVVRIADGPAQGQVALQRVATNDVTVPLDRRKALEAPLEDGVARFHDVPRGLLLVGVQVGSDPPQRALWVNPRVRGARLEFELGRASLHGRIRSPDGAAVEGARIVVSGRSFTVVATSAADGSYDAGGHFPAGRYSVAVEGFATASAYPRRSVDLAPGSMRDVSFGAGSGLSRWRGRVLTANGDSVRAGDGLHERAVQVAGRNGRGSAFAVDVVDGAIDQWFEQGVYALRRGSNANERTPSALLLDLPEVPLQGPDAIDLSSHLVRDVQLDGFVLRGRVESPDGGPASIALRGAPTAPELRAAIDAEGVFRFVGLAAGAYELRWATNGTASVAIDPQGPIEVAVDLTRSAPRR